MPYKHENTWLELGSNKCRDTTILFYKERHCRLPQSIWPFRYFAKLSIARFLPITGLMLREFNNDKDLVWQHYYNEIQHTQCMAFYHAYSVNMLVGPINMLMVNNYIVCSLL